MTHPVTVSSIAPQKVVHLAVPPLPRTPSDAALPRRMSQPSVVTGVYPKAVGATILGATSLIGVIAPQVAHAQDVPVSPDVAREARELDARTGSMSSDELAAARRALYSSYVRSTATTTTAAAPTRGERVVEETLREIERRMEVTAYDMAHPGTWTPLEGQPGYKTIPSGELRDLMTSALRRIPIGELPGGAELAQLIRALPNAGSLPLESMSIDQIKDALGDSNKAWLEAKFKPFLEKHKVEVAIAGFTSITAIRAASPTAAGFMDKVLPKIGIWETTTADGQLGADASLRYRERRVLPDLDLSGTARRTVGAVDLTATATGTIALEADEKVTGSLSLDARTGSDGRFVGVTGTIDTDKRAGIRLGAGLDNPSERLTVRGDVGVTTGPNFGAPRADMTVTVEKDLRLDSGRVNGSFGFFGSAGVDLDGKNEDVRAGLMLRLRW